MCDLCFRFWIDDRPACVHCARELSTRARRRIALGVFTALVSFGAAWLASVRDPHERLLPIAFMVVGLIMALFAARPRSTQASRTMRERGPYEQPPALSSNTPPHARLARARLLLAALAPQLSGRLTALSVLAAGALTALSFPRMLHMQRWVELELVVLSWWAMAFVGLTVVLYRGLRVDDDHIFYAPGNPLNTLRASRSKRGSSCNTSSCLDGCNFDAGGDELLFVVFALLLLLCAAVAMFLFSWLIVEIVLPLAFLGFYKATTGALRRATHDRHDCKQDWATSLRWAAIWSTLYIAPFAAILYLMHKIAAAH